MSILVIGANGGVGQYLVNQLKKLGESFTAGVRKQEQVDALKAKGIEAILIDVEADSIETLTEKVNGYDKVIFSEGSDRKSTRLNSSHVSISYAVFCLKKKKKYKCTIK